LLRVQIHSVKPGMVLALPVFNPRAPGQRLLLSNYVLEDNVVVRLKDMGVRDVWVRYPGLEALDRYIDPRVLARRAGMIRNMQVTLGNIQQQAVAKVPYELYMQEIAALISEVASSPSAGVFLDELGAEDQPRLHQSTTVSYLALLMGMRLENYLLRQRKRLSPSAAREISSLGLGAMLHDIGLMRIDPAVLAAYEKSGDESDPRYQVHTEIGYQMARGEVEPAAAAVLLHHHQHYDGSGFPAMAGVDGRQTPQSGDAIHIFARITCAAASFVSFRFPRPKAKLTAVQAIAQMLDAQHVGWFDPAVLTAFLAVVPPYAPGTLLQLSDGRWASPIDHSPDDPCKPIVQIIDDPEHYTDYDQAAILLDMRQHKALRVVRAEDQDVSDFNFPPPALKSPAMSMISTC
jgi:HD-GYP domain-containing protein (c-di-GMP phosphodiesterase class II)